MKVGIPLELSEVLPDESLSSVPVEVGGGEIQGRWTLAVCTIKQTRYNVDTRNKV